MPPRTRKAASSNDEAQAEQPVDAEVVEESPEDPSTKLGAFQAAFDQSRKQIQAEVNQQIKALSEKLDDVAAVAQSAGNVSETGGEVKQSIDHTAGLVTELADRVRSLEERPAPASAPPASGVPAVYGKVLELMRRVNEIGKGHTADYGRGESYAFRGVDDAMNAVGTAMREVGLIMETEVVSKEASQVQTPKFYRGEQNGVTVWTTTRVVMRYTFIAPEDGSRQAMEGLGVGRDSGDKDGSKALSAAMKYALFQGLCIPVKGMNLDPETDNPDMGASEPEGNHAPQPAAPPQQAQPVEPPADPWDAGPPPEQAPAPQPAPEQAQPAVDKAQRALQALAAARKADSLLGLNKVIGQASKEGLMQQEVEGMTLQAAISAIAQTLPTGQQ